MNDRKVKALLPGMVEPPEMSEEYELDILPDIVDRTKFGLREAYPNFIKDTVEIHYYETMHDQIKANGTLMQTSDANALGMLAFNLALIDKCNFSIATKGMNMMVPGDRKRIMKRNPALDVLKDAQAAVRFYLKEFKMTPGSRGNHGGNGGVQTSTEDNFDDV